MSNRVTVGPVNYAKAGGDYQFRIVASAGIGAELPANYARQIADHVAALLAADPAAGIVLDLEDLPAISSRQLGLMLELQKAARARAPRLRIVAASPGVREVLQKANVERFFELA